MAAPLGFKTFATGDVLTAADTNGYLMQGVWTFANATARDAAVTSPQEGNMCYLKDTDKVMFYSGSAWTNVSAAGNSPVLTTAQPTGDFSTSSTSFVDVTNITITKTPLSATNKIEIKYSFVCAVSTGLQLSLKGFAGATELGQYTYEAEYNSASPDTFNAIWYATNVAASSTIFKVQAKVNTGTATIYGTTSGYATGFSTLEIY
jgi:hypothetical protein